MATRNPVARAIASATSRVWFPATLAFTRNLPRRSMHRGGRALAAFYYRLRPKYLRAARTNLAWGRMLAERGAPGDIETARELLTNARTAAATRGYANVERRAAQALQDLA